MFLAFTLTSALLGPATQVDAPATPDTPAVATPDAGLVRLEARELFDPWLRHEALVLDVEWYGQGRLVTLDAGATITAWRLESREVAIRSKVAGVVELETAVDAAGDPLGLVLAYGGEQPRIEFRESSDRPPSWVADGFRGPIAVGPTARRLVANDGERLVFLDLATGAASTLFELEGYDVTAVRFGGEEVATLLLNRSKLAGLAGTEYEPAAILSVIGAEARDRRVLETYEVVPTQLARLGSRWVAIDGEGRLVSGSAATGEIADLFEAPVLCTDAGGETLLAVDAEGFLRSVEGSDGPVYRQGFVGVGARQLERSPDGSVWAVADGTTVRLVDARGDDRAGAAGPGAQVSSVALEGGRVLIGGYDRTVRAIELEPPGSADLWTAAGIVHSAVFSPASGEVALAWVARGGRLERRAPAAFGNARDVERSAEEPDTPWTGLAAIDGALFASLGDGRAIGFDASTLRRRWTTGGLGGVPSHVAAGGDSVVVGGSGLVHLSAADGARRGSLDGLGAPVESLALTADGRLGAAGLADGRVLSFLSAGPVEVATLAEHGGRVRALALSADGTLLASIGPRDERLTLTRLDAEGRSVGRTLLDWSGAPCSALAWATSEGEDGRRVRTLVAGRSDGSVRVERFGD
jgi:hypothetical protein